MWDSEVVSFRLFMVFPFAPIIKSVQLKIHQIGPRQREVWQKSPDNTNGSKWAFFKQGSRFTLSCFPARFIEVWRGPPSSGGSHLELLSFKTTFPVAIKTRPAVLVCYTRALGTVTQSCLLKAGLVIRVKFKRS